MVAMRLIPFLQSLATDTNPRIVDSKFIQLDITSTVRLYVWSHDPPVISVACGSEVRVLIGLPYHVVRTFFAPVNHGDMWRVIIDACEYDPESIAVGIAWALRLEMQQKQPKLMRGLKQ